ncbi:MAG: sigma-70 family RNA polymerase sigma factor [Myxococcaceae bacterium]|nr:sigma-70 family RNA polymerase sigma factor [Myxococcaceae bacterium]
MSEAEARDEELLARAARGETHAFDVLAGRHATPLYRFAVRMCLDPQRAQDAVQEALLAAWRQASSYRAESAVRTWLFSVLLNACRHLRRTHKGEPAAPLSLEAAAQAEAQGPSPEVQAGGAELGRAMDAALATLPLAEREVVLLRDVEGMPGDEVAALLGLSLAAMKSRLHRGRLGLKAAVEQRLGQSVVQALELDVRRPHG